MLDQQLEEIYAKWREEWWRALGRARDKNRPIIERLSVSKHLFYLTRDEPESETKNDPDITFVSIPVEVDASLSSLEWEFHYA